MKHDTNKLPKWAQKIINDLQFDNERLRKTHAVISERDWFTIQGPDHNDEQDIRYLYFLNRDAPTCICSLGQGDILLVGRKIGGAS